MNDTRLRVYDKRNKRMLIFDPLEVCCDGDYGGNDTWYADDDTEIDVPDIHEKDLYSTPMHPTGLKDKNNREIWEGDIILNHNYDTKGEVRWVDGNAEYICYHASGWFKFTDEYEVEVIGNIYENPELLEVKKCKE